MSVFYAGLTGIALGSTISMGLLRPQQTGRGLFILIAACIAAILVITLGGLAQPVPVVSVAFFHSVAFWHWTWLIAVLFWIGLALWVPLRWSAWAWWGLIGIGLIWWLRAGADLPTGPVSAGGWVRLLTVSGTYLLSALDMGTVSTAMVLGHWYLVNPALSIRALERMSLAYCTIACLRLCWAIGWTWLQWDTVRPLLTRYSLDTVFLFQRWGLGLFLAPVFAWMVYQTAKIRSTQSATGILYAAMVVTLMGEFVGLYLWFHRGIMQ